MSNIELYIIVALVSLIVGIVLGIFLGARLTRSNYLFMARMMMQSQRQAPPPPQQQRPRPHRTRQLYRDEEPYY